MKVKILLEQFYLNNGIPKNGGANDKTFLFKVFGIALKLPNPQFRRKALYIHDLQHVLNKKDTSWKGEGFIAGWEIGTGMWKHFPLSILALWAMGYSLWIYPKSVFQGFKKGLTNIGIIDMNFSKNGDLLSARMQTYSDIMNSLAPKYLAITHTSSMDIQATMD